MKVGTLNHPKTKSLARSLDVPIAIAAGILEALFIFCQEYVRQGDIGKYTDDAILEQLQIRQATSRWAGIDAAVLIDALVDAGFLDVHEKHRLIVHDWHQHAPDFVHKWLCDQRLRFANGAAPKVTKFSKPEQAELIAFYSGTSPNSHTSPNSDKNLCAQTVRPTTSLHSSSVSFPPVAAPLLIPEGAHAVRLEEQRSFKNETAENCEQLLKRVERVLVLQGLSLSDAKDVCAKLRATSLSEVLVETAVAGVILARRKGKDRPAGYAIRCMQRVAEGGEIPNDEVMKQARDQLLAVEQLETPRATRQTAATHIISEIGKLPEVKP